ncbi:MAG: glycosyltransferase, partial [Alphaproteobacteria bacterium]|nr:glycosyltransferase [Alphaproteobacteria bacterium]
IPPGKLIVSLSNLARDWSGEKVESYSVQEGYSRARDAAAQVTLDPEKQNARFDYIDEDGVFHAVWMLDAVSAFNQWQSVKHFSPRGVALWRLGTEDPSVWRLLASPLDAAAESLQDIKFSHQIDRYGVGEVTRLTGMPQNGLRRIELSTDGTRIVSESIDQFPRSFEINQWGGDDRKLLAMTFDDGPDRVFTPAVLDILQQHEVPATFFMVGNQMLRHPDLLLRAVAEGHDIGSHTYSHANISRIGADLLRLELNATQRVFESITGRNLVMFRAPYARDTNPSTVEEIRPLKIISDLGYLAVNMNIDSRDWWMPNSRRIADTTLKGIRSGVGNIILLHDGGGDRRHTVDALAEIITTAKAEGYRFVTVSELIGRSRDDVMPLTSSTPTVLALQSAGFGMVREIGVSFSIAFSVAVALGIFRSFVLIVLSSLRHRRQQVSPLVRKLLKLPPPPALSVGVIVPGYNEEKVIVQTVRSLLASTLPKLKILVVDDGSTDGTYELCRTTFKKEKRVRVVTKKNGGKSAALNFGFRRLRTDIIIAMDADTIFLPETAELLLSHFADPQVAAVSGNAKVGNRVNLLTRWQALEYITSQSLDRRAFEYLNCIAVVPGAIGAWRRDLVLAAGGFTTDTLAEDADLTLRLLRRGYSVSYEDRAIALTEAPETVAQFSKQRFRWMYGTLQVAFKHLGALGLRDSKTVGLVALPNTLIFQVLFPLLAPLADLGAIVSIVGLGWDFLSNSTSLPVSEALAFLAVFFAFVLIDFVAAVTSFCHEPKEDWRLLIWIIPQRFFYRQLIYLVAIRAVLSAIRGAPVGWGTLSRTANVKSSAVVPATASKASAART